MTRNYNITLEFARDEFNVFFGGKVYFHYELFWQKNITRHNSSLKCGLLIYYLLIINLMFFLRKFISILRTILTKIFLVIILLQSELFVNDKMWRVYVYVWHCYTIKAIKSGNYKLVCLVFTEISSKFRKQKKVSIKTRTGRLLEQTSRNAVGRTGRDNGSRRMTPKCNATPPSRENSLEGSLGEKRLARRWKNRL